jgi:multidrug efflux pump
MNFSAPFIARPVGTMMLALGLLISGLVAYRFLPVAPLPNVDIPVIVIFATRPGADPETMANSIAAPLERRIGEISGVTELTSTSTIGATSIVIQFDTNRDIDGAAHDVQAAINAAGSDLPADLPTRPYYRKVNPAEAPVVTIALTSDTLSTAQIYDAADTILGQRLSQVNGVSQVQVSGAEKPAVRVQLDPQALAATGLSAQNVLTAITSANVNEPSGGFQSPTRAESIAVNGQISRAAEYAPLILKSGGGAIMRLSDVATVIDGVANTRLAAWDGKQPAILLTVTKQAGANIIETVDGVRAMLPQLMRWLPPDIKATVLQDRTGTIRAGLADAQFTLLVSSALVLLVVLIFMRRAVPIIAAAITVPLSIAGTLAAMWLAGFSLDNFSLMALTISVGFVVDDAIVMIENIVRHMERGAGPLRAAREGSRQIGFTVLSISLSLVAVFIPVLFMGGILGRVFREFSLTLTLAIAISALVSLTLTPMICGHFMRPLAAPIRGRWGRIDAAIQAWFDSTLRRYATSLDWALRHRALMGLATIAAVVLTIGLYRVVPKGYLPLQDTGLLIGTTLAAPDISFGAMSDRQRAVVDTLLADPAVDSVASVVGVATGFDALSRGQMFVSLKPFDVRGITSEAVIARLRAPLARVGGIETTLQSAQDMRGGARSGGAQFQFVVLTQNLDDLRIWATKLEDRLRKTPGLADVSSDQDNAGPQATVTIDRDAASRLGVSTQAIDDALNNAFSQRQISTIYTQRNQYKVVLEVDPKLQTDPSMLDRIFVGSTTGAQIPLGSVAHIERTTAPVAVRHQGQFPAATLSFNLADGLALGDAIDIINQTAADLRMPDYVRTEFAGNARFLTDSLKTQPLLIGAALLSIYIVLGVLYESWIHPITILSTLPSAGLGALLALLITHTEFSFMAILGVILLMGIVKKNAIMLVDFALEAERVHGLPPHAAIREAALERFRPIIMTTLAAMMGALPLALSFGTGSELRRPLGISIIGGLIVSQALTLYTTPVVYLAMNRWQGKKGRRGGFAPLDPPPRAVPLDPIL